MSIIKSWEDYDLPNLRLGKKRKQDNAYYETDLFDGPFARRHRSDDLITMFDCSITCNKRQAREFKRFIFDVSGTAAGVFYKNMKTERGNGPQLVRILSGIPQPKQIASNAYSYSFSLEVIDFDFNESGNTGKKSLPENYTRDPGEFTSNDAAKGIGEQSFSSISISRDRSSLLLGLSSGSVGLSKNLGGSFNRLPALLASGAPYGSETLSVKISDNGRIMAALFDGGYTSISKDSGNSWKKLRVKSDDLIHSMVMSGNGNVIVLFSNGTTAFRTVDGGEEFSSVNLNNGDENDSPVVVSAISQDGRIIFASTDTGYCSICVDGTERFSVFSELPVFMGIIDTTNITATSCAMSDDGANIFLCGGNSVDGSQSLMRKTSNYGSSFTSCTLPSTQFLITACECTPDGSDLIFGRDTDDTLFKTNRSGQGGIEVIKQPQTTNATVGIASDGQSYFSICEGGILYGDIPSDSEYNYGNPYDLFGPPLVVSELTGSFSLPGNTTGKYLSMVMSEVNVVPEQKSILFLCMDGSVVIRTDEDFLNFEQLLIPYGDGNDVTKSSTSYDGNYFATISDGSTINLSFDSGVRTTEIITATGNTVLATAELSNKGDFLFVSSNIGDGFPSRGLFSDDYGKTFTQISDGFSANITDVEDAAISNNGDVIMVLSKTGRLSVSVDHGKVFTPAIRWQNSGAGLINNSISICCSDDGKYGYVLYENGFIARTENKGIGWVAMEYMAGSSSSLSINAIDCSGDGKFVVAVTDDGKIMYSDDYGKIWNEGETLPAGINIISMTTNGANWVFGSDDGRLFLGKPA